MALNMMNERVNRSAAADANVNDKYKLTGPNRMLHELNAEQLSHWNGSISNSHTEIRETRITKRTFEYTERDVQYREKNEHEECRNETNNGNE